MKTLGEQIRELREKQDLSLRELAKQLKVTAAFWSDVELGRRYPSDEVLARAATALKVKFDDLKKFDERPVGHELKRVATSNPAMGLALRRVVNEGVSPEDILRFLDQHRKKRQ